jgi:hypothetical protein
LYGRNISANIFRNPYIGLKHLREPIFVGFSTSGHLEQGVTWWQEGSLHDLCRVFDLSFIDFLPFRWRLVCGRSIVVARTVKNSGIVGH